MHHFVQATLCDQHAVLSVVLACDDLTYFDDEDFELIQHLQNTTIQALSIFCHGDR